MLIIPGTTTVTGMAVSGMNGSALAWTRVVPGPTPVTPMVLLDTELPSG
jgi:hypothetical protein